MPKPLHAATPPPAFTLDALHDALTFLLGQLIAHDARQHGPGTEGQPVDLQWKRIPRSGPIPTRQQSRDMELIADPDRAMVRLGIYRIGEICLMLHGDDAMRVLAERQWDEPEGARRAAKLDPAWSGIGRWCS